ncbi:MAG: hypothetical protein KH366_18385 [Clostridiaceae bacterium]|nr:hypothetical protein [Clostridiaceae bacterium]
MRKLRRKTGRADGGDEGWGAVRETGDTGDGFQPLSGTKAFSMKEGGPMPIHGEPLMTSPFRGISETDSVFSFCPPSFMLKT